MKIILVITNSRRKSIYFITDTLQFLDLKMFIKLIKEGKIQGFHIVKTRRSTYIRANRNAIAKDNLDNISITENQLLKGCFDYLTLIKKPNMEIYEKIRQANITEANESDIIKIKGIRRKTKYQVINHIEKYKEIIIEAARKQNIDPVLLGAILIDEYCRMGWDDLLGDWVGISKKKIEIPFPKISIDNNTSPGVAQVKMSTAYDIIAAEVYNPAPHKKEKLSRLELFSYLIQPKHSINFAAGVLRWLIDEWEEKAKIDLTVIPATLATLYSLGGKAPHPSPEPGPRGLQIYNEFYPLAEIGLK